MGKTPAVPFVFVGYDIVIPGSGNRGFSFSPSSGLFLKLPFAQLVHLRCISRTDLWSLGTVYTLWFAGCNNKMLNTREKEKPCYFLSMASPRSWRFQVTGGGGDLKDFVGFEIFDTWIFGG